VRDWTDDRASRRASEIQIPTSNLSPAFPLKKAGSPPPAQGQDTQKQSRRWTRSKGKGDLLATQRGGEIALELPLLRTGSFPNMVRAANSTRSPESPVSLETPGFGMESRSGTPSTPMRTPDADVDVSVGVSLTPASKSGSFSMSETESFHGMLGLASEFPQPPSLSPALRKMGSVPWLKDRASEGEVDLRDGEGAEGVRRYDRENGYAWRRLSHATLDNSRTGVDACPVSFADLHSMSLESRYGQDESGMHIQRERARLSTPFTREQVEKENSPLDRLCETTRSSMSLRSGTTSFSGEASWASKRPTYLYKTRTTDDLLEWCMAPNGNDTDDSMGSGRLGDIGTNSSVNRRVRVDSSMSLSHVSRLALGTRYTDGRRNTVNVSQLYFDPIHQGSTFGTCAQGGDYNLEVQSDNAEDTVRPRRAIRKVASMQSQTQGKSFAEGAGPGQRSIQKIRSLRLFPSSSSSNKQLVQQHPSGHGESRSKTHVAEETTAKGGRERHWFSLGRSSSAVKLKGSKSETRLPCFSSSGDVRNDITSGTAGKNARGEGVTQAQAQSPPSKPITWTPHPSGHALRPSFSSTGQTLEIGSRTSRVYGTIVYPAGHDGKRDSASVSARLSGLGLGNCETVAMGASKSSIGFSLPSERERERGGALFPTFLSRKGALDGKSRRSGVGEQPIGHRERRESGLRDKPFTLSRSKSQYRKHLSMAEPTSMSKLASTPNLLQARPECERGHRNEESIDSAVSFIDVELERKGKNARGGEKREKVKKFIVDTGRGLLGWRRGLRKDRERARGESRDEMTRETEGQEQSEGREAKKIKNGSPGGELDENLEKGIAQRCERCRAQF